MSKKQKQGVIGKKTSPIEQQLDQGWEATGFFT
jgi:hypothetical protein